MAELAFQRLHRPKEQDRRAHFEVRDPLLDQEPAAPLEQTRLEYERIERASRAPDPGDPLAPALRADLEQKFGRDLGHIRVHINDEASRAAVVGNALAFTRGAHIYLAAPSIAREPAIMEHELTHSIHHGAAPPVRFAQSARITPGGAVPRGVGTGPHASANVLSGRAPQPHANARAGPAPQAPASARAGPAPPAQKFDIWESAREVGGSISSGLRTTAGAIVEVGGDLLAKGRDAVLATVKEIAPGFVEMLQQDGITGFIRKLVEDGLRSMFEGLMAPIRKVIDVEALGRQFQDVREWIGRISTQLANNDCSGILDAARKVGEFFSASLQPVLDRIKSIAADVKEFFHGLEDIGAPVLDILKKLGGSVWDSLKGFVSDLSAVIRKVRTALGSAWQTVKGWLGIKAEDGDSEGGGLWGWVREKASALGNSISKTITPVLGPIRKIAGIALLVAPGTQLIGIMLLWPELKQGYEWLSKKWQDLNLIPRARDELVSVIIPKVLAAVESVGQALLAGADYLLQKLDKFHGFLGEIADATVGILAPLRKVIDFARTKSHQLIQWARDKVHYAARNLHAMLQKFVAFLGKVADGLKELIAAIVNPFGIVGFLAGRAWLALPECLKLPIIQFLLDVLERFIKAIPENPLLGVLWPLLRRALIGFIGQIRKLKPDRMIRMADKIAKIISGQSVEFALGYLKGLARGVINQIIGPFQALAAIFDLPAKIQSFLENLGVRFCDVIEQVRCFIANVVTKVFGRFDEVLAVVQSYLEDPAKLLDLIDCVIQGMLQQVEQLGATLAQQMVELFEGPDEDLGDKLGEFTASTIIQAVASFFTAGTSAGVAIASKILEALGTVGREILRIVKIIMEHLRQLIEFVKGLLQKVINAIKEAAKRLFARMKGYFSKIFGWLKKLFGRLGKWVGKKLGRSVEENAQWTAFKHAAAGLNTAYPEGLTSSDLKQKYKTLALEHPTVVGWTFTVPFGAYRHLFAMRKKSLLPIRHVGKVLKERALRWNSGGKAVHKRLSRIGASDSNQGRLDTILTPIRARYHYKTLHAVPNSERTGWNIMGSMSPDEVVATQADLKGLHSGSMKDRIPITWYKQPGDYPQEIQIRLDQRKKGSKQTVGMSTPTTVTLKDGTQHQVGISPRNLVNVGHNLFRLSTPRDTSVTYRYRSTLKKLGYAWGTRQADHVTDIGFSGADNNTNLWPLRRDVNQRAYDGKWYTNYKIEYIKRVKGKGTFVGKGTVRSLKGRHFKIIGFAWKPKPNPGGRD
jgi:phage-related protein